MNEDIFWGGSKVSAFSLGGLWILDLGRDLSLEGFNGGGWSKRFSS